MKKMIGFLLTNQCNFQCNFCYTNSSPSKNNHLDKDLIFDSIKQLGCGYEINLVGGEPTLYQFYKEIIEYISKRLFKSVTLITNGAWIPTNPKEAEKEIKYYKDKGIEIIMSVNSERERQDPDLETRMKNLNNFLLKSNGKGHFQLVYENRKDKRKWKRFIKRNKYRDKVYVSPIVKLGRGENLKDAFPVSCDRYEGFIIMPTADVHICLPGAIKNLKSTKLGNLKEDSIEEMCNYIEKNEFLKILERNDGLELLRRNLELSPTIESCKICEHYSK